MICISCGFCCKNMSPINGGYCPLLKNEGDVYYCSDYKNRPIECVNHSTPSNFCNVGIVVLKLKTESAIKERLKKVKHTLNLI